MWEKRALRRSSDSCFALLGTERQGQPSRGGSPVTDFRHAQTTNTYSGGTVRDSHPVILFSIPGSSPVIPRKPLSSCRKYCSIPAIPCQELSNFSLALCSVAPRLPLMRELSAKLTDGEKTLKFRICYDRTENLTFSLPPSRLSASHLPRQREALDWRKRHDKSQFTVLWAF